MAALLVLQSKISKEPEIITLKVMRRTWPPPGFNGGGGGDGEGGGKGGGAGGAGGAGGGIGGEGG